MSSDPPDLLDVDHDEETIPDKQTDAAIDRYWVQYWAEMEDRFGAFPGHLNRKPGGGK